MVIHLVFDVPAQWLHMRWTYGKRTISVLPMEVFEFSILGFDPLGRIPFEFPNQRRDIDRLGKPAQDMNVIFNAADL